MTTHPPASQPAEATSQVETTSEPVAAPSPAAPTAPSAARPAAARRPARPSATVSTALADAWRYVTAPKHRTYAVFGLLACLGLIGFGVYAILGGPPATVEGVVQFTATATDAQKDAVRAACPSVGGAIEEPKDRNNLALTQAYPLRYNFTKASTADQAKVFGCVHGRPGVIGISTESADQ